MSSTRIEKIPICSQPLAVTSEPLRPQQRVHEVHQHAQSDHAGDEHLGGHGDCSSASCRAPNDSQARTYSIISAKNAIVPATYSRSRMCVDSRSFRRANLLRGGRTWPRERTLVDRTSMRRQKPTARCLKKRSIWWGGPEADRALTSE